MLYIHKTHPHPAILTVCIFIRYHLMCSCLFSLFCVYMYVFAFLFWVPFIVATLANGSPGKIRIPDT